MIGVSPLPRAVGRTLRDSALGLPEEAALILFVAALGVMVAAATLRWRMSRFALLIRGIFGRLAATLLLPGNAGSAEAIAALPWFGLAQPVFPEFAGINGSLVLRACSPRPAPPRLTRVTGRQRPAAHAGRA